MTQTDIMYAKSSIGNERGAVICWFHDMSVMEHMMSAKLIHTMIHIMIQCQI